MDSRHVLEKLQATNPQAEFWWDSAPTVYKIGPGRCWRKPLWRRKSFGGNSCRGLMTAASGTQPLPPGDHEPSPEPGCRQGQSRFLGSFCPKAHPG